MGRAFIVGEIAEGKKQSRKGMISRSGIGSDATRDNHADRRFANAIIFLSHGGCSSVVELRTVAPAVEGSNPSTHPKAPRRLSQGRVTSCGIFLDRGVRKCPPRPLPVCCPISSVSSFAIAACASAAAVLM